MLSAPDSSLHITRDHHAVGSVLAFTNITAFRASIEQALHERDYTTLVLNSVVDPLVVLNPQLQVQTANRAFYALFGLSRDETQGISIRKLVNKEWETSETWNARRKKSFWINTPFFLKPSEIESEFPGIGVSGRFCSTCVN